MRTHRAGVPAMLLGLVSLVLAGQPAAAEDDKTIVHSETGEASFYSDEFQGKPTASGEPFDQDELTAAHPELPLGAEATVTNLETGQEVEVEINDRGPHAEDRIIDLSKAAAEEVGISEEEGTAPVEVEATAEQVEEAEKDETEQAAEGGEDAPKPKPQAAAGGG